MADPIKKIFYPPLGGEVECDVVPVTSTQGEISTASLEDGTVIKYKPTVLEAFRVRDRHDKNGEPYYGFNITNVIVSIEIPSNLKQQKQADQS